MAVWHEHETFGMALNRWVTYDNKGQQWDVVELSEHDQQEMGLMRFVLFGPIAQSTLTYNLPVNSQASAFTMAEGQIDKASKWMQEIMDFLKKESDSKDA